MILSFFNSDEANSNERPSFYTEIKTIFLSFLSSSDANFNAIP